MPRRVKNSCIAKFDLCPFEGKLYVPVELYSAPGYGSPWDEGMPLCSGGGAVVYRMVVVVGTMGVVVLEVDVEL